MSFTAYTAATLPSGRDPSGSQIDSMNNNWTQDSVTKTGTEGIVGMFGYERGDGDDCPWDECEDEYYFYMRFEPLTSISDQAGYVFRMWFQIGGTTSDWHGVQYTNTGGSTLGATTDLEPVSVLNSNFASN